MFSREHWLAKQTFRAILPHLASNSSLLDVGSGTGLVAKLCENKGLAVQRIDVIDIHRAEPAPLIFDGTKIPFPDNAFDTALCAFVLHHAPDQNALLSEMLRVALRVIILEDIPATPSDVLFVRVHMIGSRFRYGSHHMQFRLDDEWKQLFGELGAKVVHDERYFRRDFLCPITRKMYIISKREPKPAQTQETGPGTTRKE